jgi:hypothetical protein
LFFHHSSLEGTAIEVLRVGQAVTYEGACRLAMEVSPDNLGNMIPRDFLKKNKPTTGLGATIRQAMQPHENQWLTACPLAFPVHCHRISGMNMLDD